jgi:hypothetical protein
MKTKQFVAKLRLLDTYHRRLGDRLNLARRGTLRHTDCQSCAEDQLVHWIQEVEGVREMLMEWFELSEECKGNPDKFMVADDPWVSEDLINAIEGDSTFIRCAKARLATRCNINPL